MRPADRGAVSGPFGGTPRTRREALTELAALALGLPLAVRLAGCASADEGTATEERPDTTGRPNVIVIIVDDLRVDDFAHMRRTRRLIQEEGVTFTEARCNIAVCQPSRVGFFSGQAASHHGDVGVGYGGTTLTDLDNTLSAWLADAGYRCGLFGKFINAIDGRGGVDPPAGWDAWYELLHSTGDTFDIRDAEGTQHFDDRYDVDQLGRWAADFVAGDEQPFLCVFTPFQVHAPFVPRADLADAFADAERVITIEDDVDDKPPWVRELAPLTDEELAGIQEDHRGTLRELEAVDQAIESIISAISPDRLDNTVIALTSDNGVYRGEHRRTGPGTKAGPYDVALRVPMVVRGPGLPAGTEVDVPVLAHQDLTATVLDVAGATAGLDHQAGVSLRDLADDAEAHHERALLHEIGDAFLGHTADGVTTGPDHPLGFRKLFRYPSLRSGEPGPFTYEAYDLDTDPDEHESWAEDPARRDERDRLEQLLEQLLT